MDEFKQSIMIALLPVTTNWSKIGLPHLTLVYAGEIKDHNSSERSAMAKAAADIALENRPIMLEVLGLDIFGEEPELVEVLRLRPTAQLMEMRKRVERWNASRHPFNPHATIGPRGSFNAPAPPALAFDRVLFSWGEDDITFWMKP